MSRRGRRHDLHGVLVVDKPAGVTSAQVVTLVRRRMGVRPVGHTGTLDPLATGVLPLCLGEACKLVSYLIAEDKTYEAELELGIETDTLDVDGLITARAPEAAAAVTEDALRTALARFVGPILQVPPMYSAVKVDGRRLHKLAREGVEIEREARPVTVHRLELLSFAAPRARIRIECSKGTFVRTLAADLGRALGCGAHLTALRRLRSGAFSLDQAVPIEAITGSRYDVVPVIALPDVVGLPRWRVPEVLIRSVVDGRLLTVSSCREEHSSSWCPPPAPAVGDAPDASEASAALGPEALTAGAEGIAAHNPDRCMPPDRALLDGEGPPGAGASLPPDLDDDDDALANAAPEIGQPDQGEEPLVQLLTPGGALLALARLTATTLRPIRVFTYGLTRPAPSATLPRSNDSNP